MSKRTVTKSRQPDSGQFNPRQPCPCGSGKRYKACHGSAGGTEDIIVVRPYAGLAAECQLVALREFVPSATAPLPLAEPGDREVTLVTVLPSAAAAMVRADGTALVALQVLTRSGDLSRDLGRAVNWALTAEPGGMLPVAGPQPGAGAQPGKGAQPGTGAQPDRGAQAGARSDEPEHSRLQDLLVPDARLDITLYPDFAWWIPGDVPPTGQVALALQRANAAIMPTEAIAGEGIDAAYWVDAGDKAHLRWVRPEPEEQLLAALARLSARDELDLGAGSRYAGSFRAHGVLVPVWDLDRERHAREWSAPAEAFAPRLADALASLEDTPLTENERRVLRGLRGRQVTLR